NLRLKVKGNNAETVSVNIADVDVEPLPPYETPVPDVISIADARDVDDGELVTVEGVITTPLGIWGGDGFYLQDDTGAIYVFPSYHDFYQGQKIEVTAKKTTLNGEVELEDIIEVTDKGEGELPSPVEIETVDDSNQGQLLTLSNVKVQNIGEPNSYGTFEFDAVNGDRITRIRVDDRSVFAYEDFMEKYNDRDGLDITSVGSVLHGTYLLKPRSKEDFAAVESGTVTSAADIIETIEDLAGAGEINSAPHLIAHLDIV